MKQFRLRLSSWRVLIRILSSDGMGQPFTEAAQVILLGFDNNTTSRASMGQPGGNSDAEVGLMQFSNKFQYIAIMSTCHACTKYRS